MLHQWSLDTVWRPYQDLWDFSVSKGQTPPDHASPRWKEWTTYLARWYKGFDHPILGVTLWDNQRQILYETPDNLTPPLQLRWLAAWLWFVG